MRRTTWFCWEGVLSARTAALQRPVRYHLVTSSIIVMALASSISQLAWQGLRQGGSATALAARRLFASSADETFTVEVRQRPAPPDGHCAQRSTRRSRQCSPTPTQVVPFKAHKIEAPENKVETSLAELTSFYELMYKMRRMEIAADMMYKAKMIRGFCHL